MTEPFNLYFQSLEVVSRYRDTQLQVAENVCDLCNLSPDISKNMFQDWRHILFLTTGHQGYVIQMLIKTQTNVYCSRHHCSRD